MTTRSASIPQVSPSRDRIAAGLMLIATLAAGYATMTAIGSAAGADAATQQVEWWRALGLLLFGGLFALLGLWPRRYPGLWELVIINKAVLTIVEAGLIPQGAANAAPSAIADGILTAVLLAAYLLGRGYHSWRPIAQR